MSTVGKKEAKTQKQVAQTTWRELTRPGQRTGKAPEKRCTAR
jgi:hypothetical protein